MVTTSVNLSNILFAILFVSGKGISIHDFSNTFKISLEEIKEITHELDKRLSDTPLMPVFTEDLISLVTRPEYAQYIRKFRIPQQVVKLSDAALETLAVVIMKQPCTRQEIETIRQTDCEKTLSTLVKANLVKPLGGIRHGHPVMYSITEQCLCRFGVKSYGELKKIIEDRMKEIDNEDR